MRIVLRPSCVHLEASLCQGKVRPHTSCCFVARIPVSSPVHNHCRNSTRVICWIVHAACKTGTWLEPCNCSEQFGTRAEVPLQREKLFNLVRRHCQARMSSSSMRNSSDPGSSSASRSTFRPHAVRTSRSLTHTRPDRVASSLTDAPLPMLTESDGLTEDGHALKTLDTFLSFQNLSHAVRGCHETVNKCAPTSKLTCTYQKKPVEEW